MPPRDQIETAEFRQVAASLAKHWTDKPMVLVRHFVNSVYRIPGEPAAYLRITPATHRSRAQIESELQVLRHVGSSGVAVSQPVESRSGDLIHTAAASDATYAACLFTEAPGLPFEASPPADEKRFFRLAGRSMALLHEALSRFDPPAGFVRFKWTEDRWDRFAEHVPETEIEAWKLFDELRDWTDQLPTDSSLFGLIHGDFTIANLRIEGPRITLFDFDACCPHWRAYEIAAFLHYFGARDARTRQLAFDHVLQGYDEAHPVSPALIQQIPMFGKMRLLYSFLVFAEEWGWENLAPEQQAYFAVRRGLFASPPTWPSRGSG